MTTVEITKKHNRKTFDCGKPALNKYVQDKARQHTERGISRTYVLPNEKSTTDIIGYHTLTLSELNAPNGSHLHNKYPHKLPAIKIARLAVDIQYQGRGVGGYLLADVMSKAIQAHAVVPIIGVVVNAKDQEAKDFYLPYGFIEVEGNDEFYLFLPIKAIKETMQS